MTEQEYLLTCLAEECSEVAQRITKALRFGLDEVQSKGPSKSNNKDSSLTNRERIIQEFLDLNSVWQMCTNKSIFRVIKNTETLSALYTKEYKVNKYLNYAKSLNIIEKAKTL